MFPVSYPGITAGDIVAVNAGVPVSMKLAAAGEGAPLAGIIATNPGQVLGDLSATGQRPVALSGRVPAKVNLEGGPIAIGDRIAPSSVPGVGKKAGPFDDSVGIALEAFSGSDGSSQGSVTVFLDLQRGINIDQIGMTLLGASATTTAGTPFDFVGTLLSSIVSRITAPAASTTATSSAATSTSATSTVRTSPLLHRLLPSRTRSSVLSSPASSNDSPTPPTASPISSSKQFTLRSSAPVRRVWTNNNSQRCSEM
ncbi:MAG: hypothetical protein ACXW3T_08525 [Rhodoplanes sp.]